MKKFLLLGLFVPMVSIVRAQWNVNLMGGFSNYIGDLQSKGYTTKQSHTAFSAGLQYDLTGHFSVLSNVSYAKVGASDTYAAKADLRARNLSFETKIYEWNLLAEYNLLDLNEHRFTPYVFAGIALFHFNPYAFDSLGQKVFLRGLSTEGEGLSQYPGRKQYKNNQIAIPFGGGIKYRVSRNVVLAYEIGLRKLFTDYLDDVSSTYVDQATLLAAKGPKAVEMAYRSGEIKGSSAIYPHDGTVRGNPKRKDWYYLSGIRVTIALNSNRSEGTHHRGGGKGSVDCPKNVY
ncbi:DUF6089 family protein [Flavitalea flava]